MSDSTGTEGHDGGAAAVPAVDLTPSGGKRRRRALWGVLAVLAVAGGALAVVAADDDDPPRLPLALGASPEGGRDATASADMSMLAYVHYVAGDDLPALGGSGAAYRLAGGATEAEVRALGEALGMSGDPVHEDGYWNLESGGAQLQVYDDGGGSWWFNAQTFTDPGTSSSGGGSAGFEGCAPDDEVCLKAADEAAAREAEVMATTTSTVPADLPSRDEAETIARDLLSATGMDVDDADITVDGPYDGWYVNVMPRVDGKVVSGLSGSVGVGPKGKVLSAGGTLATPERVGDYPMIDTGEAIDRLNEGTAYGTGTGTGTAGSSMERLAVDDVATEEIAVAEGEAEETSTTLAAPPADVDPTSPDTPVSDEPIDTPIACTDEAVGGDAVVTTIPGADPDAAVSSPAIYPCTPPGPYVPEEPREIVLHEAEEILVMIGSNDGSGDMYLVPGYQMEGDDEWVVDVPSVDDESLLPTTPVEPSDDGGTKGDGGTTGSSPGTDVVDPGTTRCAPVEPGPDGAVPDICLDPNSSPPADGEGTTGSVDPG